MESFANSVLSILLGWVRGVANWVWRWAASDQGGFTSWLGRHWLGLTIALCVLGTAADVVVTLLRWRPDVVWRSYFRRRRARRQAKEYPTDGPVQVRRWVYADGSARVEHVEEAPEEPPVTESLEAEAFPAQEEPSVEQPLEAETETAAPAQAPRRRRADRYRNRVQLPSIFGERVEENDYQWYRPPVSASGDKEKTFHKPYYPPQWKRPEDGPSDGLAP